MTMPTTVSWNSLKKTAEDATRPLPADWYDITVTKAEAVKASTGADMIRCTFRVNSGPAESRTLFTNFVFSPDSAFAMSIFFRNMAAFGIGDDFFNQMTSSGMSVEAGMQLIAQTLLNQQARVEVGTRNWQGQDRNECARFAPAGSGVAGPGAPGTGGPVAPGLGGPVAPGLGGPPTPAPGVPSAPVTTLTAPGLITPPATPATPTPPVPVAPAHAPSAPLTTDSVATPEAPPQPPAF